MERSENFTPFSDATAVLLWKLFSRESRSWMKGNRFDFLPSSSSSPPSWRHKKSTTHEEKNEEKVASSTHSLIAVLEAMPEKRRGSTCWHYFGEKRSNSILSPNATTTILLHGPRPTTVLTLFLMVAPHYIGIVLLSIKSKNCLVLPSILEVFEWSFLEDSWIAATWSSYRCMAQSHGDTLALFSACESEVAWGEAEAVAEAISNHWLITKL